MSSSYPDSVRYLYAIGNELKGAKLGLERMRSVLGLLGHPEAAGRFVHVAGTNGKGSTCAMIEAGLRAAGFRTGLFTSPHLVSPVERIRLDGQPVSEEAFARAFDCVHEVANPSEHPSYFETVSAMAFLLFQEAGVDWVVLETGLGGRLDATNVVMPELCVITPVDYDHQEYLGSTIEQIATEKAGIIKPGVPVVLSAQHHEEARQVALGRNQHVRETRQWQPVQNLEMTPRGSRYTASGQQIVCPLAGAHQVENSLTAALALDSLGISPVGISRTVWPGRLEHVGGIILDGAHNPAGARALADYLRTFYGGRPVSLVFAAMRDKNPRDMLEIVSPLAGRIVVTAPATPRAMEPATLLALSMHPDTIALPDVASAVSWARQRPADEVVVFAGSLFLVGEARALLVQ